MIAENIIAKTDPRFVGNGPFVLIGAMSGTSLDGLDLVRVRFWKNEEKGTWNKHVEETRWISYQGGPWPERLEKAYSSNQYERHEIGFRYSQWLNAQLLDFKGNHSIHAIGSHGHTVAHEPSEGISLQIGNDAIVANGLGCPVVCDFRTADVQRGGQGAPLVPVADQWLYSEFPVCLNLGGFSNASWEQNGIRYAGDLGPVNFILNPYAKQLGYDFDPEGNMARLYTVDRPTLERLNVLKYYFEPFPKSLAREWVESQVFPQLNALEASTALATATAHAAHAIAMGLAHTAPGNVLVTGGGAKNTFLLEQVKAISPREFILPPVEEIDFKEAICFAFLALLRLRGEVNVFASVTGGAQDGCDGRIFEDCMQ